jgi:hypothetical protein
MSQICSSESEMSNLNKICVIKSYVNMLRGYLGHFEDTSFARNINFIDTYCEYCDIILNKGFADNYDKIKEFSLWRLKLLEESIEHEVFYCNIGESKESTEIIKELSLHIIFRLKNEISGIELMHLMD